MVEYLEIIDCLALAVDVAAIGEHCENTLQYSDMGDFISCI